MSEREVQVRDGAQELSGTLTAPENARGIVIFAHGSGSSRHSSRNRFVAQSLNEAGLATLLLDLLTEDEERIDEQTAELRFDIALLARRVASATDWTKQQPALQGLPIGYFGASTGAAAALVAGGSRNDVAAIVSRGGRPDLAGDALRQVSAPVLLIVGERDPVVIEMNRSAARQLRECDISIVAGATHLFPESGALEAVASLAQQWFVRHLGKRAA